MLVPSISSLAHDVFVFVLYTTNYAIQTVSNFSAAKSCFQFKHIVHFIVWKIVDLHGKIIIIYVPNDTLFEQTKSKAFADNNINAAGMMIFVFNINVVEKKNCKRSKILVISILSFSQNLKKKKRFSLRVVNTRDGVVKINSDMARKLLVRNNISFDTTCLKLTIGCSNTGKKMASTVSYKQLHFGVSPLLSSKK